MAEMRSEEDILREHYTKQEHLTEEVSKRYEAIKEEYEGKSELLVSEMKKMLFDRLSIHDKTAITLVDIQNDFVLRDFALYAEGGENVVIANMALLDALNEILIEDLKFANKVEIITSQDAHVYQRQEDSQDSRKFISAYGEDSYRRIAQTEATELLLLDPSKSQYGLHCMVDTIGAGIAVPITARINFLKDKGVKVFAFGKINFSGPDAGLLLKDGIVLSEVGVDSSIYDDSKLTYLQHFINAKYDAILVTGICGNVCVQQAAEGLSNREEVCSKVSVVDPAVHYLVLSTYDDARSGTEASLIEKGVEIISFDKIRSNSDHESITYDDQTRTPSIILSDSTLEDGNSEASTQFQISNMQILSGFVFMLGVAAIVISLVAISLEIMLPASVALIIGGAGVVSSLAGVGFFVESYDNKRARKTDRFDEEVFSVNNTTPGQEVTI